ncbi:hypothetical protein NIES4074_31610 [Cylindrospermum sp. NIES-4074]|nr:hypothetical protein NIES4074_31610 [Cylindrospermum sp. NIES-4074]
MGNSGFAKERDLNKMMQYNLLWGGRLARPEQARRLFYNL